VHASRSGLGCLLPKQSASRVDMVRGITATAAVMGPPRSSGPCPAMMLESQDGRKARLHAICSSWCTPELCQHAWLPAVSRLVLCCLEAVPGRPGLTTDAAAARRSCATACARCARRGWCPPSTRPTRRRRARWWTSAPPKSRGAKPRTASAYAIREAGAQDRAARLQRAAGSGGLLGWTEHTGAPACRAGLRISWI